MRLSTLRVRFFPDFFRGKKAFINSLSAVLLCEHCDVGSCGSWVSHSIWCVPSMDSIELFLKLNYRLSFAKDRAVVEKVISKLARPSENSPELPLLYSTETTVLWFFKTTYICMCPYPHPMLSIQLQFEIEAPQMMPALYDSFGKVSRK